MTVSTNVPCICALSVLQLGFPRPGPRSQFREEGRTRQLILPLPAEIGQPLPSRQEGGPPGSHRGHFVPEPFQEVINGFEPALRNRLAKQWNGPMFKFLFAADVDDVRQ